ncbi:hypothetical protein Tco_0007794 [Tanacetum coccineum]
MPIWKHASLFESPSKDVDIGDPKFAADDQNQDGDGPNNENVEKDKFKDDSSTKEVNVARQHANTASPEVNTVDPSVNTTSLYDQDSPKDMFTIRASSTLEATYVEFFSDEDESEVDLGNITNSYTVPTTPNTRIHKDHPIENVISDVKTSVQTRRMTKPTSEQGFLSDIYEQKTHDTLNTCLYGCFLSQIEPTSIAKALSDSTWVEAMQEELLQFKLTQVSTCEWPTGKGGEGGPVETKWVFRNKKDERGIVIRNKARIISTTEGRWNIISQDKYVAEILKKFNYIDVKSASTLVDLEKPLVKDGDADDVDVHLYRSFLFQVTPKTSHLLAVKRFFRYLKGKPTLGLWEEAKWVASFYNLKRNMGCARAWLGTTQIPKSSGPPVKVGDEAVHKELGDRMERAATTTSSLEAEQDSGSGLRCQDTILGDVNAQTRLETTSKQSYDPPLSRGYTLGSGEDSLKLLELMELCTKLSNMLHKN